MNVWQKFVNDRTTKKGMSRNLKKYAKLKYMTNHSCTLLLSTPYTTFRQKQVSSLNLIKRSRD